MSKLRDDVLATTGSDAKLLEALSGQVIAITGGTGFLGTWLAQTIALLNDEKKLGITLYLYARHTDAWAKKHPELANRDDIILHRQDVRSSFELPTTTNYVIHAAGIPDNRMHASDPLRVFETTMYGAHNAFESASKLAELKRFVNISSGLVSDMGYEAGQAHMVYMDAKRAAEMIGAIYRSQHRLPVSTIRPYTFIGAFQELDRPWALNNFIRDALNAGEIRLHGDGNIRRSYLYGSDAAWWILAALVRGKDGAVYHLGSEEAVSHQQLAEKIAAHISPTPTIQLRTRPNVQGRDFLPDISATKRELGVSQSIMLDEALTKAIAWYQS